MRNRIKVIREFNIYVNAQNHELNLILISNYGSSVERFGYFK